MYSPASQSSRRRFLATTGGAALLALSTAGGARIASASPTGIEHEALAKSASPVVPAVWASESHAPTAAAFDPTQLVVDYLKQWMFDTNHPRHTLLPKSSFEASTSRNYNLKNVRTRKFLQWEHQTFGINLGWTDNANPQTATRVSRWFLTRSTTDQTPLRYGERLGLGYGTSPSFLRYSKRTWGINLAWSNTPIFEWKLLGGPIGDPVSSQQWLAIYNQKAGDCLIHFDRTVGGDIGWPGSQTWWDQLGDILTKAVKEHWKEAVAILLSMAAGSGSDHT